MPVGSPVMFYVVPTARLVDQEAARPGFEPANRAFWSARIENDCVRRRWLFQTCIARARALEMTLEEEPVVVGVLWGLVPLSCASWCRSQRTPREQS
jgi:hypothetical protein